MSNDQQALTAITLSMIYTADSSTTGVLAVLAFGITVTAWIATWGLS